MSNKERLKQTVKLNIVEKIEILSCYQPVYDWGHSLFPSKRARIILCKAAFYEAPLSLIDYIMSLRKKGYKLQVELSRKEIPDEYIGIVSLWRGVRLKSRKYLKLQTICIEKSSTCF